MKPKVLILGDKIDIYKLGYIDKIPKIRESKTFKRDKLIVNELKLTVKNFDDFFSIDNNKSIFKNIHWQYESFQIINTEGETVWDGIIQKISRNHRTKLAVIISTDYLRKFANTNIEYVSSDWETPATAFKNICDLYGFEKYNQKSVQDSINQYEYKNCYIKCDVQYEDNITFQQISEKLAEIGCADCFTSKNEIYFKHYQAFTGGVKVNLVEKNLEKLPIVDYLEKDLINDYRIAYYGDNKVPAVDSDNNNIGNISRQNVGLQDLKVLNCRENTQIIIKDLVSAVYLGECYIRRTHRNLETNPSALSIIKFQLSTLHKDWIDLETYFSLTLKDEDWQEKIFEIFDTDIDDNQSQINIIAHEVT